MHEWMLEAPDHNLSAADRAVFAAVWAARDASLLPPGLPRWLFFQWLTEHGHLLHGSQARDITRFEPRTPRDRSPDEFSKRTGVYAASDGLWAMMYALKGRRVRRILNMALQTGDGPGWTPMRYFLSFAADHPRPGDGRDLLSPGFVYVLPRDGFGQMPAYDWPGVGRVLEPHWVNPNAVRPLWSVAVTPADFPLPVRLHGAARVDGLAAADPWGFPWLDGVRG